MRAQALVIVAAAALAGCQSELDRAQADYEFMKRNGTSQSELCRAGDAIVAAALKEKDRFEYQMAQVARDLDCAEARRLG